MKNKKKKYEPKKISWFESYVNSLESFWELAKSEYNIFKYFGHFILQLFNHFSYHL